MNNYYSFIETLNPNDNNAVNICLMNSSCVFVCVFSGVFGGLASTINTFKSLHISRYLSNVGVEGFVDTRAPSPMCRSNHVSHPQGMGMEMELMEIWWRWR